MKPALLLLMFLAGCTSYRPTSWSSDLGAHEGHAISISGTPVFSELGESLLYLCPAGHLGEPTSRCLDVIAPVKLVARLRRASAQCVEVSGTFRAFNQERIGMGNFRSVIGFIEAARAIPVMCANNSFKPKPLRGSA